MCDLLQATGSQLATGSPALTTVITVYTVFCYEPQDHLKNELSWIIFEFFKTSTNRWI